MSANRLQIPAQLKHIILYSDVFEDSAVTSNNGVMYTILKRENLVPVSRKAICH
jgi:hypothetical protein